MEQTVKTVARVNNVDIQIIENGEKRVAVKPICDALGIDFSGQRNRIQDDPILGSTMEIISTVGADGKVREMVTIPLEFVFGWLFLIDSRKVKPEAKEFVIRYQRECYHALYSYFTRHDEYLEYRKRVIDEQLAVYDAARADFRKAKEEVNEARAELDRRRAITEDDYFADKAQLKLDL